MRFFLLRHETSFGDRHLKRSLQNKRKEEETWRRKDENNENESEEKKEKMWSIWKIIVRIRPCSYRRPPPRRRRRRKGIHFPPPR